MSFDQVKDNEGTLAGDSPLGMPEIDFERNKKEFIDKSIKSLDSKMTIENVNQNALE